jgi:hypothetical protein
MDRNKASVIIAAIICATVFLLGIFVWPTPYRYEKVTAPFGPRLISRPRETKDTVYRINRFTGTSTMVVDP